MEHNKCNCPHCKAKKTCGCPHCKAKKTCGCPHCKAKKTCGCPHCPHAHSGCPHCNGSCKGCSFPETPETPTKPVKDQLDLKSAGNNEPIRIYFASVALFLPNASNDCLQALMDDFTPTITDPVLAASLNGYLKLMQASKGDAKANASAHLLSAVIAALSSTSIDKSQDFSEDINNFVHLKGQNKIGPSTEILLKLFKAMDKLSPESISNYDQSLIAAENLKGSSKQIAFLKAQLSYVSDKKATEGMFDSSTLDRIKSTLSATSTPPTQEDVKMGQQAFGKIQVCNPEEEEEKEEIPRKKKKSKCQICNKMRNGCGKKKRG